MTVTSKLAPGFLVAAPGLLDPNFRESVILLVDHGPRGALGFVINRPADFEFEQVIDELDLESPDPKPEVPVLIGGPVAPNTGWIVYDPSRREVPEEARIDVDAGVQVSASRAVLEALAADARTERHLLVLGYAGWSAGQLDDELREGSWIPVQLDAQVVFDTPYEKRWAAALAVLGIDPTLVVSTGWA